MEKRPEADVYGRLPTVRVLRQWALLRLAGAELEQQCHECELEHRRRLYSIHTEY